ncbi:MAG: hypothetical protein Q9227_007941 [Pyrenula ochraceoflavens]
MTFLLPQELIAIQNRWLFRDAQLQLLAALLNPNLPSPPAIVVYGPAHTGKTKLLRDLFDTLHAPFGFVDCNECISLRQFFTKAYASCITALKDTVDWDTSGRIENVNVLATELRKAFKQSGKDRLYLVCDGIDQQREITPTLSLAIARLGQLVPGFCLVLVVRSARSIGLNGLGVPFVHFPDYTRNEAISMIARDSPSEAELVLDQTTLSKWYAQFVAVVYDAIVGPTTRSMPSLRSACKRLWPTFIRPVISGESPPGKSKKWEFSKLLVRNRNMFQAKSEGVLVDRLEAAKNNHLSDVEASPLATSSTSTVKSSSVTEILSVKARRAPLLKFYCTIVLVACFLASHNAPKTDTLVFSRLSSASRKAKKSYHRRKLLQSPSKAHVSQPSTSSTSVNKSNAIAVLHRNQNRSFTSDRLIAIVRAIHPYGVARKRSVADKVATELAELVRLKLVVGGTGMDAVGEEKWMINVHRDWVEEIAKRWSIDWNDFEV